VSGASLCSRVLSRIAPSLLARFVCLSISYGTSCLVRFVLLFIQVLCCPLLISRTFCPSLYSNCLLHSPFLSLSFLLALLLRFLFALLLRQKKKKKEKILQRRGTPLLFSSANISSLCHPYFSTAPGVPYASVFPPSSCDTSVVPQYPVCPVHSAPLCWCSSTKERKGESSSPCGTTLWSRKIKTRETHFNKARTNLHVALQKQVPWLTSRRSYQSSRFPQWHPPVRKPGPIRFEQPRPCLKILATK